jgi:hypothetical protein
MMSDIRININISKEEFKNGTIPIFGSDKKGGSQPAAVTAAVKVWINALDFQEQFNNGHMLVMCSNLKCNVKTFWDQIETSTSMTTPFTAAQANDLL